MSNKHRTKHVSKLHTQGLDEEVAAAAVTEWLGGYYVANHEPCHHDNIGNTEDDVIGWMDNRASGQQKNFVHPNKKVHADDFRKTTDRFAASLPAGADGVESVFMAYVATHGETSGKVFTLAAGGSDDGGCTVSSSDMSLGE